jgi:hypothetical protein
MMNSGINPWLLIGTVVLLALLVLPWWLQRARKKRARSWPVVEGRVESSSVKVESTGNNQSAVFAQVRYSYSSGGETYSGIHQRRFMLWKRAERWTAHYPDGSRVVIRINAAKPFDSVLDEQDQETKRSEK